MQKILNIINRVGKMKAIGIIFNIPKEDETELEAKLRVENHIIIEGAHAYRGAMLRYRLGSELKIKHFQFNMLPGLINSSIICVKGADVIKPSYSRVLDEFNRYKIPLLLLMHRDTPMKDFRRLGAYQRVLTIEQDYSTL